MTEKYIVDDAGTLIDMETREMYDIVEEVCPILNKYVKENQELKKENEQLKLQNSTLMKEVAEYSRKAKELEKGDVWND